MTKENLKKYFFDIDHYRCREPQEIERYIICDCNHPFRRNITVRFVGLYWFRNEAYDKNSSVYNSLLFTLSFSIPIFRLLRTARTILSYCSTKFQSSRNLNSANSSTSPKQKSELTLKNRVQFKIILAKSLKLSQR